MAPDVYAARPQTLHGKVAIVTGASRGIGAAIAPVLAAHGARVALTYTTDASRAPTAKIIEAIKSATGRADAAISIQCDLSTLEAPAHVVKETTAAFGEHIDILVNNAGVISAGKIGEIDAAEYARVYDLNVRGTIMMTQAVLPRLRRPGRIVNLSSVGAREPFEGTALYASSKGAIEALTRAMALELGKDGTTVNAVNPGPVYSQMLDSMPKDIVDGQKARTAIENRVGHPVEVAELVAFLAEERSGWVTGQCLSASGGFHMY